MSQSESSRIFQTKILRRVHFVSLKTCQPISRTRIFLLYHSLNTHRGSSQSVYSVDVTQEEPIACGMPWHVSLHRNVMGFIMLSQSEQTDNHIMLSHTVHSFSITASYTLITAKINNLLSVLET